MFTHLEGLIEKYHLATLAFAFTLTLIPFAITLDGLTHWLLHIPSTPAWYVIDGCLTFIIGFPASIILLRLAKIIHSKELKLQSALAKVQQLEAILPMCAKCKKIRNATNQWLSPDIYIRDHTASEVSHSLCEACYDNIYAK